MVQVRVVTKGLDFSQIAEELQQDMESLKRNTLTGMAEVIAQTSPIDSGYYAANHEVALRSGSYVANKQRPDDASRRSRGEAPAIPDAREKGLSNMLSDIASIDMSKSTFVFRNPMTYSSLVEAEHAVYARARREVTQLVTQAVSQVRSR